MNECQVIDARINGRSIAVPHCTKALSALLHACDRARSAERDLWQYAVALDELKSEGVRSTELRKLIARGLVAHALEQTPQRNGLRRFQAVKSLSFTENSCFVLTADGELLARQNGFRTDPHGQGTSNHAVVDAHCSSRMATTPTWDLDHRILSLGGLIIKKFKRPAPQQELLLTSFQELQWVRHIDDPIPPEKGMCPKGRLHDTIKKLNRGQLNPLIRFYGDGTGRGACWERCWPIG